MGSPTVGKGCQVGRHVRRLASGTGGWPRSCQGLSRHPTTPAVPQRPMSTCRRGYGTQPRGRRAVGQKWWQGGRDRAGTPI